MTPVPPCPPPTAAPSQKKIASSLPSPPLLPFSSPPPSCDLPQPFGLSQYPRASRGHMERFVWKKDFFNVYNISQTNLVVGLTGRSLLVGSVGLGVATVDSEAISYNLI